MNSYEKNVLSSVPIIIPSVKTKISDKSKIPKNKLYSYDYKEESKINPINDDFIKYISVLKKYKSGGYYTFNSKELKQYLDFKLSNAALSQHKNVNGVQQFLDFQ